MCNDKYTSVLCERPEPRPITTDTVALIWIGMGIALLTLICVWMQFKKMGEER